MEIQRHLLYIHKVNNYEHRPTQTSNPNTNSVISAEEHQISAEVGNHFPEIVLLQVTCDKKSIHSDLLKSNCNLKLTSEALGDIPIPSIQKIKLYSNKKSGKIDLKIETEIHQHHFYIQKEELSPLFAKLIWLRLTAMNIFTDQKEECQELMSEGILKNVQFFNKWEKANMRLTKQGSIELFSDKNVSIAKIDSLKEFWTRLELIENDAYLVVKIWVGLFKYSLGIPLKGKLLPWMRVFCSLLQP